MAEALARSVGAGGHAALHQGAMHNVTSEILLARGSSPCDEPYASVKGAHDTHILTRSAQVVWCRVCGRHAAVRIGVGLQRACTGLASGVYTSRINRLRRNCHPITGSLETLR